MDPQTPAPAFPAAQPGPDSASTSQPGGDASAPNGAGAAAPTYLTAEQLNTALQQLTRQMQSQLDKRDRRIERLLQSNTLDARTQQALKAAGLEVPADKQAALLAQLREQGVIAGDGEPDDDAPATGADAGADDPVTVQGQQIAAMYGLNEADPEWPAMVQAVQTAQSPQAYLRAIQQAGEKRLARVTRSAAPSPAAMPALGAGGTPAGRTVEMTLDSSGAYERAAQNTRRRFKLPE